MTPNQILNSKFVDLYQQPILIMSTEPVLKQINNFKQAMPNVQINYAVKCNPQHKVLQVLSDNDCSFDVASIAEVEMLAKIKGIDFSRVLYSNPVRPIRYIKRAAQLGIKWFVVDSINEVNKVVANCSDAQLYIRIIVPNKDSQFPLTGKFGVNLDDAKLIIDYCAEHNISLRGVSFHVGSQCSNVDNWVAGINICRVVFDYMISKGLSPDFIDLGGGYPIEHSTKVTSIDEIGCAINEALKQFENVKVVAEPGRYIVSEAGHILCQVVSTNIRNGIKWVYLDVGVFHGLVEMSVDGFDYKFETLDNKQGYCVAIAGASCDSLDIVKKSAYMPDVQDGQHVVVVNAGAYTTTYGTKFNGFPAPITIVVGK